MFRSFSSHTLRRSHGRRFSHLTLLASVLLATVVCAAAAASVLARATRARHDALIHADRSSAVGASATGAVGSKADCVYTANSVAELASFQRLTGRTFACALVYNNASPDWAGWEKPWFLVERNPAYNWADWVAAAPAGAQRQLIITNNLFPSAENGSDWLRAGAAGAYTEHARALARNLVAAGLGNSVIRLAHEANGTSDPYALGASDADFRLWVQFWRHTAIAMRSVPGAHFMFDWCVNAYWRPIPLNKWYPGDDVVDIIGIDSYDAGVPAGQDRWTRLYTQPDGIGTLLEFARAHRKPLSIPEWGLWAAGPGQLGGGGDPGYIDRMAGVVRDNRVAYQSYFYNHDARSLLDGSADSLRAYRRHFGPAGDSVGAPTVSSRS
jgi:Glycosyl hydrolase family 26